MDNEAEEAQRTILEVEQDIIARFSTIKKFCDEGIKKISNEGKSTLGDSNKVGETLESIFEELQTMRETLYELEDVAE
jgi:hypothetical protein